MTLLDAAGEQDNFDKGRFRSIIILRIKTMYQVTRMEGDKS